MKFVCAGYPKTGSKSASAALRMLGYNVADYIEERANDWPLYFFIGMHRDKKIVYLR